jgi:photosystem II stability/assembly factor-like uncharacterized protein
MERLLTILLLFPAWGLFAQTGIQAAEYFYDSDPGEGLGIALDPQDLAFGSSFEIANDVSSSLGLGFHTLFIRFQDEAGDWGPTFRTIIEVEGFLPVPDVNLSLARAWWDNNQGAAVNIPVINGNFDSSFEQVFLSDFVTPLSQGLHTLHVQLRDADGLWGPEFKTILNVENQIVAQDFQIDAARVWWNADLGAAVSMLAFDGNFNEAFEVVQAQGLSLPPALGLHVLHVQMQGANGAWGPDFTTIVSVDEELTALPLRIESARYWWDSDLGNATLMPVFDGNFNESFEVVQTAAASTPAVGLHKLNIQFQDFEGNWGSTFSTVVNVEELLEADNLRISSMRYWWNNDLGNAQTMIAFDGNYNESFEQAFYDGVVAPAAGIHVLHVQVQDNYGNWGSDFKIIISSDEPIEADNLKVQLMEYWIDTDPGQGAATAIVALDGAYNEKFELNSLQLNTALLDTGMHILGVRTLSYNGSWGPDFRTVMYVDPCQSSPVVTISPAGPAQLCPGDSLLLAATPGLSDYRWYRGLDLVGTGESVYVFETGVYRVVGYDLNGCPGTSAYYTINPASAGNIAIGNIGSLNFCEGGSVTLLASNGYNSYLWSNGQSGQSILVQDAGQYSVIGTTGAGCNAQSDTLTVVVYDNPELPVITITGATNFCIGDSVLLESSYASGNFWNTGATTPDIYAYFNGDYTVTHFDINGCFATSAPVSVTVGNPQVIFNVDANVVYLPNTTVTFTPQTLGNISSYLWDFGDGTTSTEVNPQHTYSGYGLYSTSLEVTDVSGCTSTFEYPANLEVWQVYPLDDISIPGLTDSITSISFLSPYVGCITTSGGQIWGTTDGGITWVLLPTGANNPWYAITLTGNGNYNEGWIAGGNGTICYSPDGGITWIPTPTGSNETFYDLWFNGPGNGWAGGSGGTICYYGGGGWTDISPGLPGTTFYTIWYGGGVLWAGGSGGVLCYYGGGVWYPVNTGSGANWYGGTYYPGSNCIWLAGSGGTIYFSPNGGGTWIDQSPGGGYDYDLNDILVIDGLHGICVGNNGVIWVTYDGGTTWVPWSSGTDEDLLSCELIDCVFHITSASGKVYKVDLGLQPVAPEISADGPLNTCSADTLTLSVVNPRVGYTYQWSDGTVGYSTIADQPTDYWVREIGYCGEINSDTLQVTIEFATLWYADTDGDTYGDPDAEFATCDLPPPGYVSNSDDCDDTDPLRTTYCPPPCFGDFNNDQLVNAADVLILLAALNPNYCGEACVADANGDGYVSTADLLLLLAYYGTPCPI